MPTTKIQTLLNEHLPEAQKLFNQFKAVKANQNSLPKVVVYGVYNSGKSSLLNALTGHVEQEYFATRDIPETKQTKTLEQQGICYVDTPGLDVDVADTQQANAGVDQADILMFVHKLNSGPIQAEEMQTMQALVASHGKPEQLLAVITGAEGVDEQQSLINEITSQIQSLAPGCQPFLVSNLRFQKGVREAKQPLIHHSGIPQLLEALQSKVAGLSENLDQQRKEKQQKLKEQLLEEITNRQDNLEMRLGLEETRQQMQLDTFFNSVSGLQLLLIKHQLQDLHSQLG